MDYAKPTSVRLALQTIVICALIAYSGWTIQVLWGGA
jgi:succinate dehydrogenase hydrophobic anchor subunit